jgi:excisionase family DNA binding protein
MMKETGGFMKQATPGIEMPAPATPSAAAPALLTPAQVAQALSVGEADVMASLEAGDLKGKKIGTQWRVTRAAVDAFLAS